MKVRASLGPTRPWPHQTQGRFPPASAPVWLEVPWAVGLPSSASILQSQQLAWVSAGGIL